jgi:hypothetical protein
VQRSPAGRNTVVQRPECATLLAVQAAPGGALLGLLHRLQGRARRQAGRRASRAQVRLLVDQTQVGCILGKGGSIISELRRATGSSIRVLSKQEIPACAAPNDEVLQARRPGAAAPAPPAARRLHGLSRAGRGQVSGDAARVLDALQQASERLRETPSRQPIQLSRTPQPVRARRGRRPWPRPAAPPARAAVPM